MSKDIRDYTLRELDGKKVMFSGLDKNGKQVKPKYGVINLGFICVDCLNAGGYKDGCLCCLNTIKIL